MLSRKQESVTAFLAETRPLREIAADDEQSRNMLAFADAFLQATASFGVCELQARERDRLLAAEPEGTRTSDGRVEKIKGFNDKGLRLLAASREALNSFRDDISRFPNRAIDSGDLDRFETEAREQLSDLELKGPDLERILAALEDSIDAARERSARGLEAFLVAKVRDLADVRRRPDRGAAENIPAWKAIAVAVFFGVALWALFKCTFGFFGGCTLAEGAALFGVAAVAAVIARFC